MSAWASCRERLARIIAQACWGSALANLVLTTALCLTLVPWLDPRPFVEVPGKIATVVGSLGLLSWLWMACLLPRWYGVCLRIAAYATLLAGAIWMLASAELRMDQGRNLFWEELRFRVVDPGSRGLVIETLESGECVAVVIAFWIACVALEWMCRRIPAQFAARLTAVLACVVQSAALALCWQAFSFRLTDAQPTDSLAVLFLSWSNLAGYAAAVALAVASVRSLLRLRWRDPWTTALVALSLPIVAGTATVVIGWFGDQDRFTLHQQPIAAPWSWICRTNRLAIDLGNFPEADPSVARRLRHDLGAPLWAPGQDPTLAPLAGRYQHRKAVLIVMESQRLSDIDPLGIGAHAHRSLSPYLTALAARGLSFSNYVQDGMGTIYAQFSLITGLQGSPHFTVDGTGSAALLARLGRFPDFEREGFRCEWLQATPCTFADWTEFLEAVSMPTWFEKAELEGLDRTWWTSWGMPDEQLYDIAWSRYRRHLYDDTPYLMAILTVSNHRPFRYHQVAGESLAADHDGGMRYADRCLGVFIDRLCSLPEDRRPVIFITGDHGHHERLKDAQPLGEDGLESIRIPGILVTPDGFDAGRDCPSVFTHEDALDLIHLMVGAPEPEGARKFLDVHRLAVATVNESGMSVFTPTGYFFALRGASYAIRDRWHLVAEPPAAEANRLRELHDEAVKRNAQLWRYRNR